MYNPYHHPGSSSLFSEDLQESESLLPSEVRILTSHSPLCCSTNNHQLPEMPAQLLQLPQPPLRRMSDSGSQDVGAWVRWFTSLVFGVHPALTYSIDSLCRATPPKVNSRKAAIPPPLVTLVVSVSLIYPTFFLFSLSPHSFLMFLHIIKQCVPTPLDYLPPTYSLSISAL